MARFTFLAAEIVLSLALSSCAAPRRSPESERQPVAQPAPATIAPDQSAPSAPVSPTPAAPAQPPAPPPATPKPAPPPTAASPATASPGAPSARSAAKPSSTAAASAPKNSAPATPPVAKATPPEAPASPTLDLGSLEQRLKDTRAIGVFTKLSLKNQVDDLLSELRAFHSGSGKTPQAELRQKYDTLIIKVLTLLQNGDPQLATAVASSREALWAILMDPKKFSQI